MKDQGPNAVTMCELCMTRPVLRSVRVTERGWVFACARCIRILLGD